MTALDAPTDELDAFRADARAWLEGHAARRQPDTSEFKRRVALAADEDEPAHVEACKAWQRTIYDAGFGGLSVPPEYGGRGLPATYERAWRQEVARFEVDTGVFSALSFAAIA